MFHLFFFFLHYLDFILLFMLIIKIIMILLLSLISAIYTDILDTEILGFQCYFLLTKTYILFTCLFWMFSNTIINIHPNNYTKLSINSTY